MRLRCAPLDPLLSSISYPLVIKLISANHKLTVKFQHRVRAMVLLGAPDLPRSFGDQRRRTSSSFPKFESYQAALSS